MRFVAARCDKFRINLDAHRPARAEVTHGLDHYAAITGTEIVNHLVLPNDWLRLELAELRKADSPLPRCAIF